MIWSTPARKILPVEQLQYIILACLHCHVGRRTSHLLGKHQRGSASKVCVMNIERVVVERSICINQAGQIGTEFHNGIAIVMPTRVSVVGTVACGHEDVSRHRVYYCTCTRPYACLDVRTIIRVCRNVIKELMD